MIPAALILCAAVSAEPEAKTSLATESDEAAWMLPGVRVGIGYAADAVIGLGQVPSDLHHVGLVRLGLRLDANWSLLVTFRYGVHISDTPAMRYGGTIEPTYHLGHGLSLAVGLGIGGFIVPVTGAPTPRPTIVSSVTLPGSEPLLGACQGSGLLALARVEETFVVSDLFATGPALQFDAQWTACTQDLNRFDPDTGEPIVLKQYWENFGVSLAWMFWWR